jgi:hypothetical protein
VSTKTGSATYSATTQAPSEDHVFWPRFVRDLVNAGQKGVRLVVSGWRVRSRRGTTPLPNSQSECVYAELAKLVWRLNIEPQARIRARHICSLIMVCAQEEHYEAVIPKI